MYSATTTWVVKAAPVVGAAAAAAALAAPFAGEPGNVSFAGDLILLAYVLGLGRFHGARGSRHRQRLRGHGGQPRGVVSALAEPALLLGLAGLAAASGSLSLWHLLGPDLIRSGRARAAVVLIVAAFILVFLVETCTSL